jgi:hypothetical protein
VAFIYLIPNDRIKKYPSGSAFHLSGFPRTGTAETFPWRNQANCPSSRTRLGLQSTAARQPLHGFGRPRQCPLRHSYRSFAGRVRTRAVLEPYETFPGPCNVRNYSRVVLEGSTGRSRGIRPFNRGIVNQNLSRRLFTYRGDERGSAAREMMPHNFQTLRHQTSGKTCVLTLFKGDMNRLLNRYVFIVGNKIISCLSTPNRPI